MNSLFNRTPQSTQNFGQMTPAQVISMVRQSGKTPEELVKSMVANGTISQQGFEKARAIANRTLGTNL